MNRKLDEEGRSIGVLDAIDAMKEALRHNDMDKCHGCFDKLTAVLEDISEQPADENYLLKEWSRTMLRRRAENGCQHCHPPARKDIF